MMHLFALKKIVVSVKLVATAAEKPTLMLYFVFTHAYVLQSAALDCNT